MEMNEYQIEAMSTSMLHVSPTVERVYMSLGLTGEAGEVAEVVKKEAFHGHKLSHEDAAYELGDVLWYVAGMAHALGYTLNDIAQMNLKKLDLRYPEGFNKGRSQNREGGKADVSFVAGLLIIAIVLFVLACIFDMLGGG